MDLVGFSYFLVVGFCVGLLRAVVLLFCRVCGCCPSIVCVLFYCRVPDVLQLCCSDVFALV